MKKVISELAALALFVVIGFGSANAQVTTNNANATLDATINVFQPLSLTADETLDFGNVLAGETASVPTQDGATITIQGTSIEEAGIGYNLTWSSPTEFSNGDNETFGWTPQISGGGASNDESGSIEIDPTDTNADGSVVLQVGGSTEAIPGGANGTYTSQLNLTVTYTTL